MPITARRRPCAECSWSHWAEWKTLPEKLSKPAISGRAGSLNGPRAPMSTRADHVPLEVVTNHRDCASFQLASTTSWPKRIRSRIPNLSAQSLR